MKNQTEEILKIATEIVVPYGLEVEIFPDIFSVGVQGDSRTYTPVVNLIGPFPGHEVLAKISTEISNTALVNRVTFQLAEKKRSGEIKSFL